MIALAKMVAFTVIIVHVLIQIIKDISNRGKDDYYDYCHGCQCGWCTEEPKSQKCERWVNENKDHKSIDNIEPDSRS